jgi:hypothetical protein
MSYIWSITCFQICLAEEIQAIYFQREYKFQIAKLSIKRNRQDHGKQEESWTSMSHLNNKIVFLIVNVKTTVYLFCCTIKTR